MTLELSLADDHEAREQRPRVQQVELLDVGVGPDLAGERVEAGLSGELLEVLERLVHPAGDDPAHQQRLARRRRVVATDDGAGGGLDGLVGAAAGGRGEDADAGLAFLLGGESVADDAADGALVGGAEAGGARRAAERAGERGAVESEQLVAVGEAARVLLGQLARLQLHRLTVLLEARQRPLRVVHLEHTLDPHAAALRLEQARPADDLHDLPRRVPFHQLRHCHRSRHIHTHMHSRPLVSVDSARCLIET
ncbi:unknown protein [Oryza sativa Japonica Group]|uniref:Os01g0786000 protein n=2 Tax=Oryza sativa subsp. japonica TaxID=39947 RepID=A0A0P0V914_ORYSJ|nr:unknown protein [Oryza sativa Japonica Group]BAF06384.1 Os01g0786000 [Oryza sativa Japonica Group]BAS74691.1 Os01g0786000 [Oryza sativa Japonica Group]|eukprot:NP_001044470.1 Os01g0786000 [Oryza sativa Japonica Group]